MDISLKASLWKSHPASPHADFVRVVLRIVAFLMFSVKESEPSHLGLFPPIIESCITVIKYQNKQSDIGRIHKDYLNFNSFTCTHLCVYVDSFMQFYHLCRFIKMTPQ